MHAGCHRRQPRGRVQQGSRPGRRFPTLGETVHRHLRSQEGTEEQEVARLFYRVPTPPGKFWIFFLESSRTWKVLENHFGPGKSWKLKLKVLESPGKISLKVMHFSSGSNGKQAAMLNFLQWTTL